MPPTLAMFMVFQEVANQQCGCVSLVVLTFAHAAAKPCWAVPGFGLWYQIIEVRAAWRHSRNRSAGEGDLE